MDYKDEIEKIANFYGLSDQLRQLQEECGETVASINHFFRKKDNYQLEDLIEELVDLQIMLDQMNILLNDKLYINEVNMFEEIRKQKIKRQLDRIAEEEVLYRKLSGKDL